MLTSAPSNQAMPLPMAGVGKRVRLVRIQNGRRINHRLAELGLTPGVELTVLQDSGGPLLVLVRDSRIALGRGTALKISVEQIL